MLLMLGSAGVYAQKQPAANAQAAKTIQNGESVNFSDLLLKDGRYYKFGATVPFTGQCIAYHVNEMPKNVAYIIDGKVEGRFITYDAFGNKEGEARYVGGVRHGTETHFFTSGKKKAEMEFNKGVKDGTYIEYNEQGQRTKSAEFQRGEIVSKTMYQDGKAVDTRKRSTK